MQSLDSGITRTKHSFMIRLLHPLLLPHSRKNTLRPVLALKSCAAELYKLNS